MALIAAVFGFLRGIKEGMVMKPGGVREHPWFRWYHALSGLVFLSFAWLAIQWSKKRPGWINAAGLALIAWEATEIGYLIARPELGAYEHLAFFDLVSFTPHGAAVYAVHAGRIITAAVLFIINHHRRGVK